ncbi:MAG: SbcC/MukB-like Walker B domain-containing protein [Sphingomonas sp.]|jgi:energy-coupling factor transporter ATP-binding protein EcfA2|uniref:SbcC/MukB-like Walker B domain-containing protein n=1 Tax=Sphingomonas sp. TaxID=28214 RepID=UPI003565BAA4
MYSLERLVLYNWGRLEPQDIEIRGTTAILGPTGAGKSTIVDAIQVVVTGANSRYFDLNKSTGGKNARTVRDYCLGADDHISPDGPAREVADTLVALAFRDRKTGELVSIGIIFSASRTERREEVRWRFVARNYGICLNDLTDVREGGKRFMPQAGRMVERLKERCPAIRFHNTGIAYVDDYLHAMRKHGAAPDSGQVLRNFRESIAFQPIDDPTEFVRRHILEEDFIEVEALRGSIERYRFFEQEVQRRELQLAEIGEVRRRMQVWAQHLVRRNVLEFTVAHAERRRLELVRARYEEQRTELGERLQRELQAKLRSEQAITQLQEDILRHRATMTQLPEAMHLRALDAERAAMTERQADALAAAQRRLSTLARFAGLDKHRDRVPIHLADAMKAVTELQILVRTRTVDALLAIDDDLVALERRVIALAQADGSFERQIEALNADSVDQKRRLGELEQRLAGGQTGQILSFKTVRFIALLKEQGIAAQALPDLVEISDPSWAMALEMLLGAHREALLIPAARLGDAFGLLYRERRDYDSCRLIDTRKTAQWQSRLPERSIARVITTESEDIRAYVERQVGRFLMADSEGELEILDQAITKRGKTTQGMALRVYRDIEPILGKTAQRTALVAAREEFERLSADHAHTLGALQALMTARAAIAEGGTTDDASLALALGRMRDAASALRGIAQSRSGVATGQSTGLDEEIKALESDIAGHRDEIAQDILPLIKQLQTDEVALQVKLATTAQDHGRRVTEEEAAEERSRAEPVATLVAMLPEAERIEQARSRVSVAAELVPEGRDPAAQLNDLAVQAKADGEPLLRLAEQSVQRGRSLFMQFVQDHVGQSPMADPTDVLILQWCLTKERKLEDDELRQYREQFISAREKMESDLTEGLINRLSDKFQKARTQIERLNRNLAGRRFTGQTYTFRYRVNEALKPIHVLAEAIAEAPGRGLSILDDDGIDPRVKAGFRDLEKRLADEDLVKDLRDYRKFFDFDLHMRNDAGQETTLSKRSVTGSGGQKQAPYYVAVGAAMAAAYFPKSTGMEPEGLGLVVFDEAFNNLDAPNTRALLEFFNALHLQVLVAAPDKVRAMFLETVDTIVSVNRRPDTQEPMITVTRPTPYAREALAGINPVNRGVEYYRPEAAAAE